MKKSREIGRFVLLKHLLILLGVIIAMPIVIQLINNHSVDVLRTLKETFKLNSMNGADLLLSALHLIVLSIGIWVFGGKAGKSIIEDGKPKYRSGFLAVCKFWILHLASSFALQAISFGLPRYGYAQLALVVVLLFGLVHSLIDGHFIGNEIKRKGKKLK